MVRSPRRFLPLSLLAAITASIPAAAETSVPIGSTQTWTSTEGADGGSTGCRHGSQSIPCGDLLGETAARPDDREVETSARIDVVPDELGRPVYSTASVYNDFFIPGPPDTLVLAQITVQYDFSGNLAAGGLYAVSNALSLRVQDRTDNALVAKAQIAGMMRQGDQGLTDVAAAQERSVLEDERAHMTVVIRRGHHYRVHLELESTAVSFQAGLMRADAFARWDRLSVAADEDEVERLAVHDAEVKSAIAQAEANLAEALAIHDADIKAELADIRSRLDSIDDDLEEIKRLLLTPPGRRPGFPYKPPK